MTRAAFFARMDREAYVANPRKPPWDDRKLTVLELIYELQHHQAKLVASFWLNRPDAVAEHAADIANFCQKAAELFGPQDMD